MAIVPVDFEEARKENEEKRQQVARSVDQVAVGGGGPHDPGMELRVTALEADMKDVKAGLSRLEVSSARIEAILGSMATKSDLAASTGAANVLSERVSALDVRFGRVERAVEGAMTVAISKSIGPWQFPAILGASAAVLGVAAAAIGWLVTRPWSPH